MKEIERLLTLQKALEIEKKHETESFKELLTIKTLHQLTEEGLAWYPLSIVESGFTLGEYPYLTLEIAEDKRRHHQFKSGSIIQFFHNHNGDIHSNSVGASIYYISKNQVKIILEADDFPEWYDVGKIGFVQSFDEKSQKEMEIALQEVIKADRTRLAEIRDHFYFPKNTPAQCKEFFPKNQHLNTSQHQAIEAILGDNLITIVHGPPGTGKTTTLVEAIFQKTKLEKQILVCAPSNSAVDLLVLKLSEYNIPVLRIGNISRINEIVLSHTMEYKIEHSSEFQDIKKLRKQADEYRRMANKYSRNFGKDEREQRKLLINEAKDCHKSCKLIEDYLINKIIDESKVICCTLVGVQNSYLKDRKFETVFIDEVSQAMEPATWIPIIKSNRVVLAGDPFQLPPTVKSMEASKMGLSTTLLDIGFKNEHSVFLLNTQYRMHPEIMGFSNQYFYQNKLLAAYNTHSNLYELNQTTFKAIQFIDTAGCGFEEKQNPSTLSYYNPDEYILIRNHLNRLLIELNYKYQNISVGIISPYKEQTLYFREKDAEDTQFMENYDVKIHTIDSFQGQEKDIIYISLVRSNQDQEIGFLKDYRRMNVAMTRARKMLIVVGDSTTLSLDPFYSQFIEYCTQNDYYLSAWELIEY